MRKNAGEKGFTLIEMIIAVVLLSVLAAGIMRIFITSQVTHQKAVDLDYAILRSTRIIEEYKNMESIKESSFTVFFDDNWEQTDNKTPLAKYAIYGDIGSLKKSQGGLFIIEVRAVRLSPYPLEKAGDKEIYKLSSVLENKSFWGENP